MIVDPYVLPAVLLILGVAFVFLELFIPSHGILGFLAGVSVLAAIYVAFRYGDSTIGLTFSFIAVAGFPLVVYAAFKIWPR